MVQLSLNEIVKALGGENTEDGENIVVSGISTDSRKIQEGDLFVPLIGENFDGHDYMDNAFKKGAVAALSQKRKHSIPGRSIIQVGDTLKALQNLAGWYRSRFSIPFIGITGSVGKTSTKDMVACALGVGFHVLRNEGNLNNEIGVPLTIFRLDGNHEAAVVEMGMSGSGEIGILTSIVRPKVGIITNIGISHIEKLGSRQNILKAKLEILEGLQPDGLLVLNGDDALLSGVKGLLNVRTVSYGLEEGLDYQAYHIQSRGEAGVDFNIMINGREFTVSVPSPGVHNVYNALAAIAAGYELGVPVQDMIKGIAQFSPGNMRLNIIKENGLTIINDAYNASPQSVKAALDVLAVLDSKRKIAVLGDMLELGEWSHQAHMETGSHAAEKKLDYLVTVGHSAEDIGKGAVEAGLPADRVFAYTNNTDAMNFLNRTLEQEDAILVKGSRGMKMEEIVNYLTTVQY